MLSKLLIVVERTKLVQLARYVQDRYIDTTDVIACSCVAYYLLASHRALLLSQASRLSCLPCYEVF
jgi:hypothetical protein